MARSNRIEFAGAFYHVMARGNHMEATYKDDAYMKNGVSVHILAF